MSERCKKMTEKEIKTLKEILDLIVFTLDHTTIPTVDNLYYCRNKLNQIYDKMKGELDL